MQFFDKAGNTAKTVGNYLLTWNPRPREKQVVRNAKIGGSWGSEERGGGWPFTGNDGAGQFVTLTKTAEGWEVTIDGARKSVFDFKERSAAAVARIEVIGSTAHFKSGGTDGTGGGVGVCICNSCVAAAFDRDGNSVGDGNGVGGRLSSSLPCTPEKSNGGSDAVERCRGGGT